MEKLKLGKAPKRLDPRTLQLSKYIQDLPPFPESVDWGKKTPHWGMMANDAVGDCTCAAAGHLVIEWCANEGVEVRIQDADVLAAYSAVSGYDPKTGLNDNGAVELDVLNRWRTDGFFGGHHITAFAALHENNPDHLKAACYLFGGAYIGLALPTTAQNQDVWEVVPGTVPGSWGGHAVPIIGYNQTGPVCVTWGEAKQMTWAFYQACCDEAYAVLGPEWTGSDKVAPNGFNLTALIQDLQLVATGVRQSEPQENPKPNTGGSTMQFFKDLWTRLGLFFKDLWTRLVLFFASPVGKWLEKVVRDSAVTYIGLHAFVPSQAWFLGLGSALVLGIYHGLQTDNPIKMAALKATLQMVLLFGFVFALSCPVMAYDWNVPKKLAAIPSGLDVNALVLMPTAAFSVGTVQTSYGFSVAYSLIWGHIKGTAGSDTSTVTNKLGLGVAGYMDLGDWLQSGFKVNPRLKGGVGVLLPQLCGVTPGVEEVWDFVNKSRTTLITINAPFSLLNSLIVKL